MSDQDDWERKCREARELAKDKPAHVRALVELSLKLGEAVRSIARRDPEGAKAAWSLPHETGTTVVPPRPVITWHEPTQPEPAPMVADEDRERWN